MVKGHADTSIPEQPSTSAPEQPPTSALEQPSIIASDDITEPILGDLEDVSILKIFKNHVVVSIWAGKVSFITKIDYENNFIFKLIIIIFKFFFIIFCNMKEVY